MEVLDFYEYNFNTTNNTPIGFADTYPAAGTVFRFSNPTTGIKGLMLNDHIEVYPTLANSHVTVALSQLAAATTLQLTDMGGKVVLSQPATLGDNQLNTSNLAVGTYVLCVLSQGEKLYYKISKQ